MGEPRAVFDPEAVTSEWLTDVLTGAGVLDGERVVGFEAGDIGTGQVGANIRYRLRYDRPEPAGPSSIVAKFAARDETSRTTGIMTRTYETEVAFYREVAGSVDVDRPACYLAAIVPGTADVVLVLEDLAPAVPGDQIAGCDVEQAGLAMDQAARLHGPRWGDPTLLEHVWLTGAGSAVSEPAAATAPDGDSQSAPPIDVAALYAGLWPGFLDRYRATLDPAAVDVGGLLCDRIGHWATQSPATFTITHGDYRLDNMLFDPTPASSRPLTVVDWQTARLGCGTADVAYFLGAGLVVEARRAHERDLVHRYHQSLLGYGVEGYPFDACWEDYRRYAYGGYVMAVIASMLVGRTERGDAMFMAMANRHAAQATDLGSHELI